MKSTTFPVEQSVTQLLVMLYLVTILTMFGVIRL